MTIRASAMPWAGTGDRTRVLSLAVRVVSPDAYVIIDGSAPFLERDFRPVVDSPDGVVGALGRSTRSG